MASDEYFLYFNSDHYAATITVHLHGANDLIIPKKYDGVYKVAETNGSYVLVQNTGGHVTKTILPKRTVHNLVLQYSENANTITE